MKKRERKRKRENGGRGLVNGLKDGVLKWVKHGTYINIEGIRVPCLWWLFHS